MGINQFGDTADVGMVGYGQIDEYDITRFQHLQLLIHNVIVAAIISLFNIADSHWVYYLESGTRKISSSALHEIIDYRPIEIIDRSCYVDPYCHYVPKL